MRLDGDSGRAWPFEGSADVDVLHSTVVASSRAGGARILPPLVQTRATTYPGALQMEKRAPSGTAIIRNALATAAALLLLQDQPC